jgi:WD40 repeat protein
VPSFRISLLLIAIQPVFLFAQPKPEGIEELRRLFETERQGAVRSGFDPSTIEVADKFANQAKNAVELKQEESARRYLREARWSLPYRPAGYPENVKALLGSTRMKHGHWVQGIALNSTETKLASVSKDGVLKIWDLQNGRETKIIRFGTLKSATSMSEVGDAHSLSWSQDNRWIAIGVQKEIIVLNAETGEIRHRMKGHTDRVNSISFRPDGKFLSTCSDDETLRIWDLEKGIEVQNFGKQDGRVYACTYSPNGKIVAAVNAEGQLTFWLPDREAPAQKLVHASSVHNNGAFALTYSRDGTTVFTGGADFAARQIGAPGLSGEANDQIGTRLKSFEKTAGGHQLGVTAVAISEDGTQLATGGRDALVILWNPKTSQPTRVLRGHGEEVTDLKFSKDGTQLFSSSKDQSIRIWALKSIDSQVVLQGHQYAVWSVAISPDNSKVYSAGADRTIRSWEANSGKLIKSWEGHSNPITSITLSNDGNTLFSTSGDRTIKAWNTNNGELQKTFVGHEGAVMALAIDTAKNRILTGGLDRTVRIWDLVLAKQTAVLSDSRSLISSISVDSIGRFIAVGGSDGIVRIYSQDQEPKLIQTISCHSGGVSALEFSPDGQVLATSGGDRLVKFWKVPASAKLSLAFDPREHTGAVSTLNFSRDGQLLASAGADQQVKIWNTSDGREVRTMRGHTEWIGSVAFFPNRSALVSGGVDQTVRIWELTTSNMMYAQGHQRAITSINWSRDGELLASASEDRTVRIWNAMTGKQNGVLPGHRDTVNAVAFDPRTQKLLSAGADDKLRTWNLTNFKQESEREFDAITSIQMFGDVSKVAYTLYRKGNADRTATLIQVENDQAKLITSVIERETRVRCTAIDREGKLGIFGLEGGVIHIWDLEKGTRIAGELKSSEPIVDLVISPDLRRLILADTAGQIQIWDLEAKTLLKKFPLQIEALFTISVSADGNNLLTGAWTGEVKMLNLSNGETIRSWNFPAMISQVQFHPNLKQAAIAAADGSIAILNLP